MKRSEMVKKIEQLLIYSRDFNGLQLEAEELLSEFENMGMLPPEHYRPMDWKERNITYSQWLQESSKIRTWEPE